MVCNPDHTPNYTTVIPCASGEICRDGACVSGETSEPTCADSDADETHPDGLNPNVRGIISGTHANGATFPSSPDYCMPDSLSVREMVCNPDHTPNYTTVIPCATDEICLEGACIPVSF